MMTVAAITTSNIRNWIRTSDLDNLELVVLEGHGQKLLTENASDNKIRQFLKSVPGYIVSRAHFVSRGQQQTNPIQLFLFPAKDWDSTQSRGEGKPQRSAGSAWEEEACNIQRWEWNWASAQSSLLQPSVPPTGLLRCTELTISRDIVDWLVDKYPESMGVRDNVSTNYRILRLGTLLMYTRHHRSDHDQEIIIPQTIFIYTFSTFC